MKLIDKFKLFWDEDPGKFIILVVILAIIWEIVVR